jgi:hypothetical protein
MASTDSRRERAEEPGVVARNPDPLEDGGAIMEFFGQLWYVPDSTHPDSRVREGVTAQGELVWIAKEKWEMGAFAVEDCFPIGARDVWSKDPVSLNFAEKVWGKGERKSFI